MYRRADVDAEPVSPQHRRRLGLGDADDGRQRRVLPAGPPPAAGDEPDDRDERGGDVGDPLAEQPALQDWLVRAWFGPAEPARRVPPGTSPHSGPHAKPPKLGR